jgi:L-ascorbate metabolism protein UlaG (beta-lactamase superfamily)
VFTDPFLSNPGMSKVSLGKIMPDTALIERLNPKTTNIRLMAIGHSHYDHILDLPYFAGKADTSTIITGSLNTLLMTESLDVKLKSINVSDMKATSKKSGDWVYTADRSIRVMAIKSEHLPHIFNKHLYKGQLDANVTQSFPFKGKGFLQDETLAYLFDFLDEQGAPVKRVYFSSSASAEPNGFLPESVIAEKPVDVAILSLAMAQKADAYPSNLVNLLQPDHIIFCHWENFFRPRDKKLKFVSMTKYKKIKSEHNQLNPAIKQYYLKPGHSIVF